MNKSWLQYASGFGRKKQTRNSKIC
jgi:hypothetical protein